MIEFLYHDGIQKEIAAFERRFPHVRDGLLAFELLCNVQFSPTNPKQVIARENYIGSLKMTYGQCGR